MKDPYWLSSWRCIVLLFCSMDARFVMQILCLGVAGEGRRWIFRILHVERLRSFPLSIGLDMKERSDNNVMVLLERNRKWKGE
jgi:hypothetical protein